MPAFVDKTRLDHSGTRGPSSFAAWLSDMAAVALAYGLALAAWHRPVRLYDLVAIAAIGAILFWTSPLQAMTPTFLARLLMRRGMLLLVLLPVAALSGPGGGIALTGDAYFLAAWGLAALPAIVALRFASPWALRASERLTKTRSVVIVGVSEAALRVGRALSNGTHTGQVLVGYFDDRSGERVSFPDWARRLGGIADVGNYVKEHRIDCIYIALPVSPSPRMVQLLQQTHDTTASVYLIPNVFMDDLIQCRVSLFAGVPTVAMCESPLQGSAGVLKRAMDVTLSAAAMPVLLPMMGLIAMLVRLTSPGPAIFKQRRYGLDGREIIVWKFRTMTTVEDGCTPDTYHQVRVGDTRVTPLGRFLRRTSLDELPQFLHVLSGTMSLVGPRPHALAVNEECRKLIPRYMLRHKVRPGITGWAQVNGCRGGDDLAALRRRTECDIEYLKTWSVWLDLQIIWRTALLLVRGDQNAY